MKGDLASQLDGLEVGTWRAICLATTHSKVNIQLGELVNPSEEDLCLHFLPQQVHRLGSAPPPAVTACSSQIDESILAALDSPRSPLSTETPFSQASASVLT